MKKIVFSIVLVMVLGISNTMAQKTSTTHIAIGDVLLNDGTVYNRDSLDRMTDELKNNIIGIVFYVDHTGNSGWAVDLKGADNLMWADNNVIQPLSTRIPTFEAAFRDTDGNSHTVAAAGIAEHYSGNFQGDYPAYGYVLELRNSTLSWYLPALGQLNYLYAQIPEINTTIEKLPSSLGAISITLESDAIFWTSTELDNATNWALKSDGSCNTCPNKTLPGYVRAVINF